MLSTCDSSSCTSKPVTYPGRQEWSTNVIWILILISLLRYSVNCSCLLLWSSFQQASSRSAHIHCHGMT